MLSESVIEAKLRRFAGVFLDRFGNLRACSFGESSELLLKNSQRSFSLGRGPPHDAGGHILPLSPSPVLAMPAM
jgi:hypothetical protein